MLDIELLDIKKIAKVVHTKYGYDFENYAISSFKRRILRVMEINKINSVDTLIHRLENDANYINEFISEITVNVTEMFRDPSFWKVLKENIIPNILLNHNKITIWHAGCSSGEEVMSMVILLKEMGIEDKARIVATDLDHDILKKAQTASFSSKNMVINNRNYTAFCDKDNLNQYFTEKDNISYLNKDLYKNVSFRKHDLVKGDVFSKFDLILCRNVMIYFNQFLQNEVLIKLHESLFKYGFLAIGSKESLIWCEIANKFIVVNNEEKIYKKIKD